MSLGTFFEESERVVKVLLPDSTWHGVVPGTFGWIDWTQMGHGREPVGATFDLVGQEGHSVRCPVSSVLAVELGPKPEKLK